MLKQNHPPRWTDYRSVRYFVGVSNDFSNEPNVNRFGARYRFAKSFSGTLEGYSSGTATGYAAIMRLALTWSAFEALLAAIKLSAHDLNKVSVLHDPSAALSQMRAAGKVMPFFQMVAHELKNASQKKAVLDFIAGTPCCGLVLAKGVRHIFFHGTLTPNARQADASAVAEACLALTGFLVAVMDAEFSKRVDNLTTLAREAFPERPEDAPPWSPF